MSRNEVDVNTIITQPLPLPDATVDIYGDITKSDGDLQVRCSCVGCIESEQLKLLY